MLRPFILDKELDLTHNSDLLGTNCYVEQLVNTIKYVPDNTAYTIGLYGGWGCGKSTIIETAKSNIESSNDKKYKVVLYDAWKYSGDSFRRMFLLQLQRELGISSTDEMSRFYEATTEELKPNIKIKRHSLIIVAGIILLCAVIMYILYFFNILQTPFPATAIISLGALFVSISGGVFYELKVSQTKNVIFAPEQFEECFRQMMTLVLKRNNNHTKLFDHVKTFFNKRGKTQKIDKLIIIIDNLDRCETGIVYSMLTDIKTFLGCEKYDVIFVIPVDKEALQRHLDTKNLDADEFLRKIFNAIIRIKSHRKDDLLHYTNELNNTHNLRFNPNTLSFVANIYAKSPRRIVQALNNITIEQTLYSTDFSIKNETLIAVCLTIRLYFPEMVDLLLKKPDIVFTESCYDDKGENSILPNSLKSNKNFFQFMRVSKFTLQNASHDDIRRILTHSDKALSNITDEIIDAIKTFDYQTILSALNDDKKRDDIFIEIIRQIRLYDSYDAEDNMMQMAECIARINSEIGLRHCELQKLDDALRRVYYLIPRHISYSMEICRLASNMENIKEIGLKTSLINFVKNRDNEKYITYHNYIWSVLEMFKNNEDDCKSLSDFAERFIYENPEIDLNTISFSEEQKTYLFTSKFVETIINDIKSTSNVRQQNLLIWCILNLTNIELSIYDKFFAQMITIIGRTQHIPLKDYISVISFIMPVLRSIYFEFNTDTLQRFFTVVSSEREIYGGRKLSIALEVDNDNANKLIDFSLELYRISGGHLNIFPFLLLTQKKCETYLKNQLVVMRRRGANLLPFCKNILSFTQVDDSWYELIPVVFEKNENGTLCDEKELKTKLKILYDNISNEQSVNVILNITQDKTIREWFMSLININDAATLRQIPLEILPLIVDLYTNDTYTQFETNNAMLEIVLKQGNTKQRELVRTTLINRINNQNDINGAIEVIELYKNWSKKDREILNGVLQCIMPDDKDDGESTSNILTDIQRKVRSLLDKWR